MMSKINQCVKQVDESRIHFLIIVNHITDQEMYDLYEQKLANDNYAALFKSLRISGYSFNIKIDRVVHLGFDKKDVRKCSFNNVVASGLFEHSQSAVNVEELKASNEDLSLFEAAAMTSWVAVNGGLAVSAIGRVVWLLYKGDKWAYRGIQQARARRNKYSDDAFFRPSFHLNRSSLTLNAHMCHIRFRHHKSHIRSKRSLT